MAFTQNVELSNYEIVGIDFELNIESFTGIDSCLRVFHIRVWLQTH